MISDRAPSECSWDSNDDELRGSFSTDGDGKHIFDYFIHTILLDLFKYIYGINFMVLCLRNYFVINNTV
jgi:hypothetical protein